MKSDFLFFGLLWIFSALAQAAEEKDLNKSVNSELEAREKLRQEFRLREEAQIQEDLKRIEEVRRQIDEDEKNLQKLKLKFEDLLSPEVRDSSCLVYTYSLEKEIPPRLVAAVDFQAKELHRLNELHDLVKDEFVEILNNTPEFGPETYAVSAFAGTNIPYKVANAFTRVAAHPKKLLALNKNNWILSPFLKGIQI